MSRNFIGPLLIALAALAAAAATLAPDGAGPGITCDEPYHVFQGKKLFTALREQGAAFFAPDNIEENFNWPQDGPPVQAPLGYWILGATHHPFDPEPGNPLVFSIAAARFAPAAAYALLIFLVGVWTSRREGAAAGAVAAAAVALTPRLFGHAHFAALDMLTTLFFVSAVLAATDAARSGKTRYFALAGMLWGAAMLVRLHGLLLAPPVIAWLIWRYGRHSLRPVLAWTAAGAATFFVGWPWLWLDPWHRFLQYLSTGPYRMSLNVFYWGQVWADHDAPWHYPWVMFAVTVPAGLLLLGLLGLFAETRASIAGKPHGFLRDGEGSLIIGTILFILVLFSWPGTPVYDGVRLFLMVFPLWAIWVGVGAKRLVGWINSPLKKSVLENSGATAGLSSSVVNPSRKNTAGQASSGTRFSPISPRVAVCIVGLFVALQAAGLFLYHPCQLSYYNLFVGGLAGANKLGFETTYWGDSIREPLLAEGVRLAEGGPILFAPNLAPFQAPCTAASSPSIGISGTELIGLDPNKPAEAERCRFAVIYNRRADSPETFPAIAGGKVVAEHREQGIWLSRLVELNAD